jgi:ATP-binding cassette subfamily F protein 3
MQERVMEIEEEIAKLESGIAECETALGDFVSAEETQRQTELLDRRREDLGALMAEWEELSGVIEANAVGSA